MLKIKIKIVFTLKFLGTIWVPNLAEFSKGKSLILMHIIENLLSTFMTLLIESWFDFNTLD